MELYDDELILAIRQKKEEALKMLLFRYEKSINYFVNSIFHRTRYCGIEAADLKSVALEAFYLAISTYDEHKACFYSYWKLLTEREIYGAIKKYDSKSHQLLSNSLSFDKIINEDGEATFAEYFSCGESDIVNRYNANEELLLIKEADEEYLSSSEKSILAHRMMGYSYEEIEYNLKISNKQIERALRQVKKII